MKTTNKDTYQELINKLDEYAAKAEEWREKDRQYNKEFLEKLVECLKILNGMNQNKE